MPLYEYECLTCQKVHDVVQKFADAPLTECPECQSPVKKLISRSSFALKGSGWYTTDYKRAGPKPSETSNSSEAASAKAEGPATTPASTAPAAPAASPAPPKADAPKTEKKTQSTT